MKHLLPFLLIVAFWSPDSHAQSAADEAAILQTFESWNRGWADADADLAVQDYADDADWTNAFGDRFEGKRALRDGRWLIVSHLISQAKEKR